MKNHVTSRRQPKENHPETGPSDENTYLRVKIIPCPGMPQTEIGMLYCDRNGKPHCSVVENIAPPAPESPC